MSAGKTTLSLLETRLFSLEIVWESKMSLQYVLCFSFLTVDFEKRNPGGLGKKELQQRAEFYIQNKSYEDEIFYFVIFFKYVWQNKDWL